MKSQLFFISVIVAGMISFTSCKKFLDVSPKGYVIPQTTEDFEWLLNNNNLISILSTDLDVLSDDFLFPGVDKAALAIDQSARSRTYQWLAELYSTPDELLYSAPWTKLYGCIYQYNAVINGIGNASGGTPERKKIALARARAGRALCYWYLVNLYAKPYHVASAGTDPGVPWVVSNDIMTALPGRGNVQTACNLIVAELQAAIPDLPVSAPDPYQLTRAAGYGILARTWLMMGNYAEAGKMAGNALQYNARLIDYNTAYTEAAGQFAPVKNGPYTDMLKQPEHIYVQHYTMTMGLVWQAISRATEKLFEPNDLRRMFVNLDIATNTTTHQLDSTYRYMMKNGFYVCIGITTPEMLLIRAECAARQGDVGAAMNDINLLRKNRIKTSYYKILSATSPKEAVRMVLAERRKELLFKGARWLDMRRLNEDPDFGFTAHHDLKDGTTIDLLPGSNRYTLLIPVTALTADITQNPL
ncbi:RagB/SusD family nutrient uptake outer membrane protein [Chitinophaga nivalis]|uniref:RagB/SusD family nutrient uptake outer membrane protein n=1 Tax=Chitinophaga nivalis TaxID=2991709 RepID=A0ABT3IPM3_9BACT|nr:RagB/SusD family nutrient uptake outer membrane protein [Chitinophaga nivalis]MCW3464412.1 RagB/SusD family nutrient uptake outer membrane protein [Chitinophaga nivalis]MCW3485897.1 RagB/SusD family nutrient uptake outer membrane protein [Chitinophaga nivalis]